MQTTDNRLVDWAIEQTKSKYADEIAILLEHNTYSLESDRRVRYVNTIISDAEPPVGLARTFIINGIGYDFWQRSWESFERDAEAKTYFLTVLAQADILYARSEADRQRFLYLRAKLMSNLADFPYMYQRGLEWVANAMVLYKTMVFETGICKIRKAAGNISDYLSVAIACLNQTYFRGIDHIAELREFRMLPESFLPDYEKMLTAGNEQTLKEISFRMIQTVRDFFREKDIRKPIHNIVNIPDLAAWYQECSYYFRRLYAYCEQNNASLAFQQAYKLQPDLDDLMRDYQINGLDILSYFDAKNLAAFAKEARKAENRIVDTIHAHNIRIDSYNTVEDFLAQNP